jgi:acyl-CoA thioester hydrolase
MPNLPQNVSRDNYRVFADVTTRWKDNDVYGHINNAVYNAWMDTAVTEFFRQYWPEMPNTPIIPVAVETLFTFGRSIAHPADVETAFRVERIGNSSVQCGVGVFLKGDDEPAGWGHMTHVWVDRETNQSVPIPAEVRRGLESVLVAESP